MPSKFYGGGLPQQGVALTDETEVAPLAQIRPKREYWRGLTPGGRIINVEGFLLDEFDSTGSGSLRRTIEGLVFRDQFTRDNGNEVGNQWEEVESSASDAKILSNELVLTATTSVVKTSLNVPSDLIIQVTDEIAADSRGIFARGFDLVAGGAAQSSYSSQPNGSLNVSRIFRVDNDSQTQLGSSVSVTQDAGEFWTNRMVLAVSGSDVRVRNYLYETTSLTTLTTTPIQRQNELDTSVPSNLADNFSISHGVSAPTTSDEFFICGRNVVIRGLTTGETARLDSGSENSISSGVVTIDVDALALPATTLTISNSSGAILAQVTPTGGIWGGDEYTITAGSGVEVAGLRIVQSSIDETLFPTVDDAYDLGSAAVAWQDAFFEGTVNTDALSELNSSAGIAVTGVLSFTGDILPGTDSTFDVGRTSFVWAEGWFDAIRSDGVINFSGSTEVNIAGFLNIGTSATFDVSNVGTFGMHAAEPQLLMDETGAAANNQVWDFVLASEQLRGRIINDANNSFANWLEVDRAAQTVSSVRFPGTAAIFGADPGGSELVRIESADDSIATYFRLSPSSSYGLVFGSGTSSGYIPLIRGEGKDSSDTGLFILGQCTPANDSGSTSILRLDARQDDNTALVTRRLLEIANNNSVRTFWNAAGDIFPGSDSTLDLGGTSAVFAEVWVDKLENDGIILVGRDFNPDADSTHDLGATGAVYAEVWTDLLNSDGTLTITPAVSMSSTLGVSGAVTFTTDLTVANGGTGASSFTDGGVLLGSGAGAITALGVAANGQLLIGDGTTDPVLASLTGTANEISIVGGVGTVTLSLPDAVTIVTLTLTNDLTVANGGTGASTFTDGGILLGSGTSAITALGVAANGEIPIGDGTTDPVLANITGTASEVDITNGAGTIQVGLPNNITIAGTLLATGVLTHNSDILPGSDSSLDLGATGSVLAEVWTDLINSDGTLTITPDTTISGNFNVIGGTKRATFENTDTGAFSIDMKGLRGTSVNTDIARILSYWDGNNVSEIRFLSGADGVNKDDGHIAFFTSPSASTPVERGRVTNDGAWIFGAEVEIDGDLNHDGSNIGFFGAAPVNRADAYTRNATIVEDRTLLASASATATNNNNVLAALIADLTEYGLLQ